MAALISFVMFNWLIGCCTVRTLGEKATMMVTDLWKWRKGPLEQGTRFKACGSGVPAEFAYCYCIDLVYGTARTREFLILRPVNYTVTSVWILWNSKCAVAV